MTATLKKFTVSTKSGESFSVNAADYDDAADKACRKLNKGKRNLSAHRVTGDPGKSGWFQGYQSDAVINGLNSVGKSFHVM